MFIASGSHCVTVPLQRTRAERRRDARKSRRPGKPVAKLRNALDVGRWLVDQGHAASADLSPNGQVRVVGMGVGWR